MHEVELHLLLDSDPSQIEIYNIFLKDGTDKPLAVLGLVHACEAIQPL
jgi:hypothetical protein